MIDKLGQLEYIYNGLKSDRLINIKKLTFIYPFNEKIPKKLLPSTLDHLEFTCDYNYSFEKDFLPKDLEVLRLSNTFNQIIKQEF